MMKDAIAHAEERMKKAMEALRRDLSTIRTGRASPRRGFLQRATRQLGSRRPGDGAPNEASRPPSTAKADPVM